MARSYDDRCIVCDVRLARVDRDHERHHIRAEWATRRLSAEEIEREIADNINPTTGESNV